MLKKGAKVAAFLLLLGIIDCVLYFFILHNQLLLRLLLCVMLDVLICVIWRLRKKLIGGFYVLAGNRDLLWDLAKNDFKTRFAGSYLGIVWAFVQPIVTILVYWFVFQVGFKNGSVDGVPYALWLSAGLIPWFFFSEALNSATNGLLEYSYLVKKVVFNIQIIPFVKLLSALFVHLFFLLFLVIMFILNGITPTVYWLQLVYYSLCMLVILYGLSYITSALVVFFRDMTQIINVVLQIGVWLTPIMWQLDILGENHRWIFKLNPMYYVVNGYRDSLIEKCWFWEHFYLTVYFWLVALSLIGIGNKIFRKLKIHFADVL